MSEWYDTQAARAAEAEREDCPGERALSAAEEAARQTIWWAADLYGRGGLAAVRASRCPGVRRLLAHADLAGVTDERSLIAAFRAVEDRVVSDMFMRRPVPAPVAEVA